MNENLDLQLKKGDHVLMRNPSGDEFLGLFEKQVDGGRCSITIFGSGMTITNWELPTKALKKLEKFDPKLLKTGDAVLVRDDSDEEWRYSLFSHLKKDPEDGLLFYTCGNWYYMCIPYNIETERLTGTKDDAPEFYDSAK